MRVLVRQYGKAVRVPLPEREGLGVGGGLAIWMGLALSAQYREHSTHPRPLPFREGSLPAYPRCNFPKISIVCSDPDPGTISPVRSVICAHCACTASGVSASSLAPWVSVT